MAGATRSARSTRATRARTGRRRRRRSSRPTCRPRPPGSCAACTTTGASSTTGSSHGAGVRRAGRRPADARRTGDRPVVETRELGEDELGRDPGRGRARVPGARAARARSTSSRTPTTAATSWASPGTTRSPACRWPPVDATPTGARSCRTGTAPNPPLAELVVRLRAEALTALDPDRHHHPHRPARDRTRPTRWGYEPPGPSRDVANAPVREPDGPRSTVPVAERPFAPTRRRPRPRHARRLGRVRARPRARPRRPEPKVVIIVGADARRDRRIPRRRRRRLRRGDQVHLERRQGLQPERDLGEGQGGRRRARRSSSTSATATAGPARTRTTPKYTTKDGFGLNATAGAGDYEQQVLRRAVRLDARPGAERGRPAAATSATRRATPSRATRRRRVTVARQRVDNYARRLPQGRRPRGHRRRPRQPRAVHPGACSRHTQRSSDLWRSAPNFHDHVKRVRLDPDAGRHGLHRHRTRTTGGYYRSMVAKPGLTTDDVTGATSADTSGDPAKLVVPGNAAGRSPPGRSCSRARA